MNTKDILTKALPEYLPEFIDELRTQINSDNERWGDTWKERGLIWNNLTQEERFYSWMEEKYIAYKYDDKPFPWLKVAGEAFIGLIREKYLK